MYKPRGAAQAHILCMADTALNSIMLYKVHLYNDIRHLCFEYSLVQMIYLKIGAGIVRSSFTRHLHLGACMILDGLACRILNPGTIYLVNAMCWSPFSHRRVM